jgi:hypothetical protein
MLEKRNLSMETQKEMGIHLYLLNQDLHHETVGRDGP